MSSMSSALTARETNRLHRWAMWRMTVNEGIISCIRDNGTTRVLYPDSSSDTNSLASDGPDFHEFPFITPEQMSLARKLNLREKYGSNHGLSDDAYFIFGLPRINVGKDIPEVTSTGTRSVYETFSELGEGANTTSRGMAPGDSGGLNMTYSELGPTPDSQSIASHNDMEVQRINGYREEGWKNQQTPARLNLYSIQEELNNNTGEMRTCYSSNRYPDRDTTNHYPSDRYPDVSSTNPYSSQNTNQETEATTRYRGYQETRSTDRYPSSSYREEAANRNRYLPSRYQEETSNLSSRYLEDEAVNHYVSSRYPERDTSNPFASDRSQDEPAPTYSVREVIDRYEAANRSTSPTSPVFYTRQTSNRSSSDRFNRNVRSPPQTPRQDIYPPFSHSRQNSRSPTRRSYSPLPSSPRQSQSSLPTSPTTYPSSPTYTKQNYAPLQPSSPRKSSFPSGGGGGPGVGSPGYGNKMRPTRLMSDGEAERMKRQAYYDWTTPVNERYMMDFTSPARYS